MCGIAGIVAENAGSFEPEINSMISSLHHRGPDGNGKKIFPDCVLGHTRLSIIDQEGGQQPMSSTTSPKTIVFNGEIYGYRDIRNSLSEYRFGTHSDTEVILALYEAAGERCLDRLPGMFSFAIWDQNRKVLFAARDRFGEKPFYYAWGENGEFIFASEIKAILSTGLVRPKLSRSSLMHYLRHLYVHPANTIYENIFVLPPAHYLILEKGKLLVKKYWSLPQVDNSITLDHAVEQFRLLFDNAVRTQLVADVPVGAFLSGGLDSSTIVGIASVHTRQLQTFSFGFEDSVSELPFAREIAEKFSTDHHELTAGEVDIADLLIRMADVYDEPFADSSCIPTYLIAQLSRKYLKVALTGDGGDELLGGYGWYDPLLYIGDADKKSRVRMGLLYLCAKISLSLPSGKTSGCAKELARIRNAVAYSSVRDAHERKDGFFSDRELKAIGLSSIESLPGENNLPSQEMNTVNDAMMMDLEDYMPGDILVKIDRASMAHGLELRAPFLDVSFASFCISLPGRLKITRDEDKIILRRCFEHLWTEQIRKRSKQGFGAPVEKWLKRERVRVLKKEYLDDQNKKIFRILSFKGTRPFVLEDSYRTWILLVLSIWAEGHDFEMGST